MSELKTVYSIWREREREMESGVGLGQSHRLVQGWSHGRVRG